MVIDRLVKEYDDVDPATARAAEAKVLAVMKAHNRREIVFPWRGEYYTVAIRTVTKCTAPWDEWESHSYSHLRVYRGAYTAVPKIVWRQVMRMLTDSMLIEQLVEEGITDEGTCAFEAADKVKAAMQNGGRTAVTFTWQGDDFDVVTRTKKDFMGEFQPFLEVFHSGTRREVPAIIWRRVMMALAAE